MRHARTGAIRAVWFSPFPGRPAAAGPARDRAPSLFLWPGLRGAVLALLAAGSLPALAAPVAYHALGTAYVVDWNKSKLKADVVHASGRGPATFTQQGNTRLVHLTVPYAGPASSGIDDCGQPYSDTVRIDRLAFKLQSGSFEQGSSAVVELGQRSISGGCLDGQTLPYGDPADAGLAMAQLPLASRAPMAGIGSGVALAGLHENASLPPMQDRADVATWGNGGRLRFRDSGKAYPVEIDANGWLKLKLAAATRGYTRLTQDAATGEERWLIGELARGQLKNVTSWWVVPTQAGASFGGVAGMARTWENGLGLSTPGNTVAFFHELYADGSMAITTRNLQDGSQTYQPGWQWVFDGERSVQRLDGQPGSFLARRVRVWDPVRSDGDRRWVLYDYTFTYADGHSEVVIPRRLMYYLDRGAAVLPGATASASQAAVARPAREPGASARRAR